METRPRRIYRALLAVLPRAFRLEAEADLLAVFDDAYGRIRRGHGATARFWIVILCDLAVTAVAERAARRRRQRVNLHAAFSGLGHDVRHAIRALLQRPGWTALNAGTLAVGLAATVVAVVLVRDVLLAPLPFPDSGRLVRLREMSSDGGRWWPSFPNARDWREQSTVFTGVGIGDIPRIRVVVAGGSAVRVPVSRAAAGLFETLGVRPAAGRFFTRDENTPGGAPAAIVTEAFWRGSLAGQPLNGLHVRIGGTDYAVVGVLPASFRFLGDGAAWTSPADIWTPMERDTDLGQRSSHGYHVVARLADGVTIDRARMEMSALSTRLKAQHHEPTQADAVEIRPLQDFVIAKAMTARSTRCAPAPPSPGGRGSEDERVHGVHVKELALRLGIWELPLELGVGRWEFLVPAQDLGGVDLRGQRDGRCVARAQTFGEAAVGGARRLWPALIVAMSLPIGATANLQSWQS